LSTGGAVGNTGLALFRLGRDVRLLGKVGADTLGRATLDVLRQHDPRLADGMIISGADASSYTLVLNLPGVDRSFLHCPGANHTFSATDVPDDAFGGATWFHFGYPTLMRSAYEDGGLEMRRLFTRAQKHGLVTSLDMSHVDPASPAGTVDWRAWLAEVLPVVDIFLPSIDETLVMLDRRAASPQLTLEDLREVADELIALGCQVIGLKLGEQGFYLRTAEKTAALNAFAADQSTWHAAEVIAPCFEVDVVGTTGAGDAAIAGFITAAAQGCSPEVAATMACAVGAASVEAADATSGIPVWEEVQARIEEGWARRLHGAP
jgi:sugar/nucleoside kinase (ribokinase family)